MFLLFLGLVTVIGAVIMAITMAQHKAMKQLAEVQNKLAEWQAKATETVQNYSAEVSAFLAKFSYDNIKQQVGALNLMAEIHTKQIEAVFNSVMPQLYNASDLPAMKLPVAAVRNVTNTGCEVLVPKGANVNVFVIGKGKVAGFMNRVVGVPSPSGGDSEMLEFFRQLRKQLGLPGT
jgi:hypothetical protein